MAHYNGSWKGEITEQSFFFEFDISRNKKADWNYHLAFKDRKLVHEDFMVDSDGRFSITISENHKIWGTLTKRQLSIFLQFGFLVFHQTIATDNESYSGKLKLFNVEQLKNQWFYLAIENGHNDEYEAYSFLGDVRFSGFWCTDFQKKNENISFRDGKTGLDFKGTLDAMIIDLDILFNDQRITTIQLSKYEEVWIRGFNEWKDDFQYSSETVLKELETKIIREEIPQTNSIVISKSGEIIYEKYFNGYDKNSLHDQRSAAKSVGSAIIGILTKESIIGDIDQSVYQFLPKKYIATKTAKKEDISIKSLLTMSSGLDAVDFGIERKSVASEYSYQSSKNWTNTILNAPMINQPFQIAYYGGANPHLLGVAFANLIDQPYQYMHEKLFDKLSFNDYIIQTDDEGRPYFGGGMHFTTRDMIKFGEMYLEGGKGVITKEWVSQSFKKYFQLENTKEKNEYGFLFWHKDYQLNGSFFTSIEARGNGGQYIFVIPELDVVAAITSSNFNTIQQPEMIMEDYLLPYLILKSDR